MGGSRARLLARHGLAVCTGDAYEQFSHRVDHAITRDLGWRPEVSFEQGVSNILGQIDYWREAPLWDPQSIAQASKVWFQYMTKADANG